MGFFNVNGRLFRFYKAYMKVFEVLFLNRRPLRSKIFFSITTLTQVTIVLMCVIHRLANGPRLAGGDFLTEHICVTICGVLTHIALWVSNRSMGHLIASMTEEIEEPEDHDIIERHNRPGPFIFYGLAAITIIVIFVLEFPSIPVVNKFIFESRRDTGEFTYDEIWLTLLTILVMINTIVNMHIFTISFLFFWNGAMHLSAQYKILKKQFQNFLSIRDKKVSRKEFRRLVDRHNHLLDLSRHLEDTYTFVVAFNIFLRQALFCVYTYRLVTTVDVFYIATFFRLLFRSVAVVQISAYYYAGDYLTACSEEIGDVFTQCNWYNLSKKSITDFSIVIARCQKPVKLTAAKIYKLNLSNLKYVFNSLYSYMACIVAVVKATRK